MKVKIGPYVKWWGPYQIADAIPLLGKDTKKSIGEWLSKSEWLSRLCNWNYVRQKRQEYVRIDNYDTWNMDHTLALIILPMLKKLKDGKCGAPYVDDEDVPEHMRHGDGDDNWVFYKWEWILNEMIFAFESIVDDSWENQFYHDADDNHSYDKEGHMEYVKRIANGLRLFGRYYRALWS